MKEPDSFAEGLVRIAKDMGLHLVVERDADSDGYRLKARLPVSYCTTTVDVSEIAMKDMHDAVRLFVQRFEALQCRVFDEAYEHLQKHDIAGQCDSLKRITLQACRLALKYMPASEPEYQEIEHCLEYVEHLDKKKER